MIAAMEEHPRRSPSVHLVPRSHRFPWASARAVQRSRAASRASVVLVRPVGQNVGQKESCASRLAWRHSRSEARLRLERRKDSFAQSPAVPARARLAYHLHQETRASAHPRAMSPRQCESPTPHCPAGRIPVLAWAQRRRRQPRARYRSGRRSALPPRS